jgi:hypothetical protein
MQRPEGKYAADAAAFGGEENIQAEAPLLVGAYGEEYDAASHSTPLSPYNFAGTIHTLRIASVPRMEENRRAVVAG